MPEGRRLAALALLSLLAACFGAQTPKATPEDLGASLRKDEVAKAEAVARDVIADQGASVTSASVIARSGTVKDSTTGHIHARLVANSRSS
jgi:hypothetical protein